MTDLGGPGWYFQSLEEAEDWLDFDADGDEQERRSYSENDRFEEWRKWRIEAVSIGRASAEREDRQRREEAERQEVLRAAIAAREEEERTTAQAIREQERLDREAAAERLDDLEATQPDPPEDEE